MQIFRMALSIESGISTVRSIESCTVQLGKGDILDLKFVDDNTLFVLWNSKGMLPYLLLFEISKDIQLTRLQA